MENRTSFDIFDTNESINFLIDSLTLIMRNYNTNMNTLINGYNTNTRTMLSLIENLINLIDNLNERNYSNSSGNGSRSNANQNYRPTNSAYRRNIERRPTLIPRSSSNTYSSSSIVPRDSNALPPPPIPPVNNPIRRQNETNQQEDINDLDTVFDNSRFSLSTPANTTTQTPFRNRNSSYLLGSRRTGGSLRSTISGIANRDNNTQRTPLNSRSRMINVENSNLFDTSSNSTEIAMRELIRTARDLGTNAIESSIATPLIIRGEGLSRNGIITEEQTSVFQMDTISDILNQQINNLQDVIVRPSQEQIDIATSDYIYTERDQLSNPEQRCPISMDEFEIGDTLCRINYCGHIFKKQSLIRWFETNVRCPVCRFDIREIDTSNNEVVVANDSSSDGSIENIVNEDQNVEYNDSTEEEKEEVSTLSNEGNEGTEGTEGNEVNEGNEGNNNQINNILNSSPIINSNRQSSDRNVFNSSIFTFELPIVVNERTPNIFDISNNIV